MSYYLEPDSHIKDKVKVVLDFPNYATGVDTPGLAIKRIFHCFESWNWKTTY